LFVHCATCPLPHFNLYIKNTICEERYNTKECCNDGGDCDAKSVESICPNSECSVYNLLLGNDKCDNLFNTKQCCYDGGDCLFDTCETCKNILLKRKINDGICDQTQYQAECCFDGVDCLELVKTSMDVMGCRSCTVLNAVAFYANGVCNKFMETKDCCYDGGDCDTYLDCDLGDCHLTEGFEWKMGDGICDIHPNAELSVCCYDGFDCQTDDIQQVMEKCPQCIDTSDAFYVSDHKGMVFSDNFCDWELNDEMCCYDGGDCELENVCKDCIIEGDDGKMISANNLMNDGYCQPELMYSLTCCFDAGDCPCPKCQCRTCDVTDTEFLWFGDFWCDESLNNEKCCYDNNDCLCDGCIKEVTDGVLGDGICDNNLEHEGCCFDMGDCTFSRCKDYDCPVDINDSIGDGWCDIHLFNMACCYDEQDCGGWEDSR
jgi:hypothetical protein